MARKYSQAFLRLGTENAFKIRPHITFVEKMGQRVICCNLGEPDFDIPDCVKEAVIEAILDGQTHYCDPQGLLCLREAVAQTVNKTRGINISPDEVVIFPGAKPSIRPTIEMYCDPGDEVIYPSPGFPIYESITQFVGAKPVPIMLQEKNGFVLLPEQLEECITPRTRIIVLNSPSNPTGGNASREQNERIAEVILRKCSSEVIIYSDEIYEDILFDGRKHESIASIPGMRERTIISGGVSKSFAWTGGRVGWICARDGEETQAFTELNINIFSCVAPDHQIGAAAALNNERSKEHIAKMVSEFQRRRDLMVAGLNAISGISCHNPEGAFYVFPNIQKVCEQLGIFSMMQYLSEEEQQKTTPSTIFQMFLLFHYGVATLDRRSFGQIGCENQHYLRISIATSYPNLEEALERIAKATKDVNGLCKYLNKKRPLY